MGGDQYICGDTTTYGFTFAAQGNEVNMDWRVMIPQNYTGGSTSFETAIFMQASSS